MSTIYFTRSSLDGFTVDEHGSLDWLMSGEVDAGGPYGRLLSTASEWSLIESGVNRDFVCARWRNTTR